MLLILEGTSKRLHVIIRVFFFSVLPVTEPGVYIAGFIKYVHVAIYIQLQ